MEMEISRSQALPNRILEKLEAKDAETLIQSQWTILESHHQTSCLPDNLTNQETSNFRR